MFLIHFELTFDSVCSLYHLLQGFIYLWFRTTVLCFIHLKKCIFTIASFLWCIW